MNLAQLHSFLEQAEIPEVKKPPKTFLGIAKQPHYENVLSNIYAFYFNVDEEHNLSDLFIKSLLELLNSDLKRLNKTIDLVECNISTEPRTEDNGRIDLLLENDDNAIIIENKVWHRLDNNLKDYWDTIKVKSNRKIGVILSIKNYNANSISHNHYVHISHLDLMSRVMENSGAYLLDGSDKYIVFLKDFYQNIINISSVMNTENLEFYYKHQNELNRAADLMNSARRYIIKEVESVCDQLTFNLKKVTVKSDKKLLRYFKSKKHSYLKFTILFGDLLNEKKELKIVVELSHEAIEFCKKIDKGIFSGEEKDTFNKDFFESKNKRWAHFATQNFTLNFNEISDLGSFIIDKMENGPLKGVFNHLEDFLTVKRIN
tara:strand:- start:19887 stop:21008 length:1122 start_codon:yes stop_codon:yes gene_type:complete